jgi:hypothetical protein
MIEGACYEQRSMSDFSSWLTSDMCRCLSLSHGNIYERSEILHPELKIEFSGQYYLELYLPVPPSPATT